MKKAVPPGFAAFPGGKIAGRGRRMFKDRAGEVFMYLRLRPAETNAGRME